MIKKIIKWIENNAKLSLLVSFILFAIFAPGLSQYRENNTFKSWLPKSTPLIQTVEQFEKDFGNDLNFVLALHNSNGIFNQQSIKILRQLTDELWRLPHITRVETLSNYNYISAEGDDITITPFLEFEENFTPDEFKQILDKKRIQALNHRMLSRFMIDQNGKSTLLFAQLAPSSLPGVDHDKSFHEAEKLVARYQGIDGHEIYLAGNGSIDPSFRKILKKDQMITILGTFTLISLYLLVIFQSFLATILILSVTGCTVAMTMGICFYLGYEFNVILSILPVILLAIAVADSVHILSSYYQFRGKGYGRTEATSQALTKNFLPTLITTITTMVGFFGLTLGGFKAISQVGLLGLIGCFLAWLYTIFFMGGVLFLFDLNISKHFKSKGKINKLEDLWDSIVPKINRGKWLILVGAVLLSFFALFSASRIKIENKPYDNFLEDHPLRVAHQFVKEYFGSASGPEIVIRSGREDGVKNLSFLHRVDQFKNWLNRQPYTIKTIDLIDIIKDMNQNLNGGKEDFYRLPEKQQTVPELLFLYTVSLPPGAELTDRVTINYNSMRINILWNIFGTEKWLKHSREIEQKAKEFQLDISLTGNVHIIHSISELFIVTFIKSLATALVLISLTMLFIFRSIKISFISILVNFFPLLCGAILMYFIDIGLGPSIIMAATVCLGIAIDDTVHFLSNYFSFKEKNLNDQDAIAQTLKSIATPLIVTTFILATGFGVNAFSQIYPNIYFSYVSSFVLIAALLIDLIALPALLFVFNRSRKI